MHLFKEIKRFQKKPRILFTTPCHCQGKLIPDGVKSLLGKKVFEADFSEIEGFDNIRNPEGVLLKSLNQASEIYGSRESYYLFNGSSSGILALMLATVKHGEKVLIARNAHISVYNALVLSGAVPVWLNTDFIAGFNIPAPVNPCEIKHAIEQNNDIKALWLTCPTYEGIISDIKAISEICKKNNILLIVDEAHGALWNFSENLPVPAIKLGADASVQSLHKTAGTLTQCAILHVGKNSGIDSEKLQHSLNLINSTSPSYPLLLSIEGSINHLNSTKGRQTLENLLSNVDLARKTLAKNDKIILLDNNGKIMTDPTKIFVGIKGLTGYELSEILMNKYNIEDEFCTDIAVLAITGIGTSKNSLKKLTKALLNIAKNNNPQTYQKKGESKNITCEKFDLAMPEIVYTPKEAFLAPSKNIGIEQAAGMVSKEAIIPYPPGIPVLLPGERIKPEHMAFLKEKKEIKVISQ
jgi:arginine/lysine/ornithine decarboxylase